MHSEQRVESGSIARLRSGEEGGVAPVTEHVVNPFPRRSALTDDGGPMTPRPVLVFVYGVDGGLANDIVGTIHKIVSPGTYVCNLCKLTYGPLGQRAAWTQALKELPHPTRFVHRAEFVAEHGPADLPAIYVERDGKLDLLVPNAELQAVPDLDALIALVRTKVREVGGGAAEGRPVLSPG
jgi:hypothetical protein